MSAITEHSATASMEAQNLTTSGQGLALDRAQNGWLDRKDIEKAIDGVDGAVQKARTVSQTLSTGLDIITTREDFSEAFGHVLAKGANKLTLANQNDEGAAVLAQQTREQLATTSLSIANQAQQSILRLF